MALYSDCLYVACGTTQLEKVAPNTIRMALYSYGVMALYSYGLYVACGTTQLEQVAPNTILMALYSYGPICSLRHRTARKGGTKHHTYGPI